MRGAVIKDHTLVEPLGRGTVGEVWVARHASGRRVAIKLLTEEVTRDPTQADRFFNEAAAVRAIRHPGTVEIYDHGVVSGRAFLIMELLAGETLAKRLARGPLPLALVGELGRELASVLAATHAAGITHRDLKPENLYLVPDGARTRVKVIDFGIAKIGGGGATATSSSMGTPAYMSPEQWKDAASAGPGSDVYAFGCLAFEMCTGKPPFPSSSIGEACTRHLTQAPPRASVQRPDLPPGFDDLLVRMLAKAPEHRPPLAEIEVGFGSLVVVAPAPPPAEKRGALIAIALVAIVAIAIVAVVLAT